MKTDFWVSRLAAALSLCLMASAAIVGQDENGKVSDRFNSLVNAPEVSTTIVISQVYGGGGGTTGTYMFDYVELKNVSNSPQSLNGLVLMYGSATGQFGSSSTNIFALPDVTIAPGKYYLVQTSTAGTGGVALPVSPDVTTTNLNLSGTSGKIALVTTAFASNSCGATATPCTLPNASIIDLVAWGAANNAEGGAPTNGGVAITATDGNVRKNNGCTDTDNNNNDFTIVSGPVPRNSASASTTCAAGVIKRAPGDFNGDGKTDFSIVRPGPGGGAGNLTWWIRHNGPNTVRIQNFGLNSDFILPADYDGDGSDDIAVWRSQTGMTGFWILSSKTGTASFSQFGQPGDDPAVIADYTNDGADDMAIYRPSPTQGYFWIFASSGPYKNRQVAVPWGNSQGGDTALFGDYNGDGYADFTIYRAEGTSQRIWTLFGSADLLNQTFRTEVFGSTTDLFVPGDYDGDGKTDLAVTRFVGTAIRWIYKPSSGAPVAFINWGLNATDLEVHGDYDGDGTTDLAIWRNSGTLAGYYIVRLSGGGVMYEQWGGLAGDTPTIWEFK
jgi:hypothetical protein